MHCLMVVNPQFLAPPSSPPYWAHQGYSMALLAVGASNKLAATAVRPNRPKHSLPMAGHPIKCWRAKVKTLVGISTAVTLARALGGPLGGTGIEPVPLAKSADAGHRRSTLLDRGKTAISGAATRAAILGAPGIFDGRGRLDEG